MFTYLESVNTIKLALQKSTKEVFEMPPILKTPEIPENDETQQNQEEKKDEEQA